MISVKKKMELFDKMKQYFFTQTGEFSIPFFGEIHVPFDTNIPFMVGPITINFPTTKPAGEFISVSMKLTIGF
jgi:hypothetical protein